MNGCFWKVKKKHNTTIETNKKNGSVTVMSRTTFASVVRFLFMRKTFLHFFFVSFCICLCDFQSQHFPSFFKKEKRKMEKPFRSWCGKNIIIFIRDLPIAIFSLFDILRSLFHIFFSLFFFVRLYCQTHFAHSTHQMFINISLADVEMPYRNLRLKSSELNFNVKSKEKLKDRKWIE